MRNRALAISAALATAVAVGACGSSKAPGVVLAPSSGATAAPVATTPTVPPQLSKKPTVTPSDCGTKTLVKKDLIPGTGATVQSGQTVTVNYVGVLCKTGQEFDSSWKRNQPFTTALTAGSVIPGWVQGIPGMKVGGRRELIIPAALAYGAKGSPPTIPPNSPLVFVVDALSTS
jgi:peptidylprolyl isomerase